MSQLFQNIAALIWAIMSMIFVFDGQWDVATWFLVLSAYNALAAELTDR